MSTPYDDLPDFQFHSRIIRGLHPSGFDPVTKPRFCIREDDSIMTMGSCFAQHLSKWLLQNGYNLLCKETDSEMGGGVFSANYGNVYTVQQASQLFDRAFGTWKANDEVDQDTVGRFYDPLRPSAHPQGMLTADEILSDRHSHENVVRELFLSADVLVFTLGLTEAWVRKSDRAVLPLAPGVAAGEYRSEAYEFHNFSYEEVQRELRALIKKVSDVNDSCKILLTVSPVPLAATYEPRHVAVSSVASKAILRAVVENLLSDCENVEYFPSFEIFMTPSIGAGYFDHDARNVTPLGVAHAMRIFEKHFVHQSHEQKNHRPSDYADELLKNYSQVICDEERIKPQ